MLFDYSLSSTEQHNLYFPYVSRIQTADFDGMKLEDARSPLPSTFTEDAPHDRVPPTQRPSHRPRIVSDSAVTLGQSYDKLSDTLEGLPRGPRYQRNLSVGSQPYLSIQDLELAMENSTRNSTANTLESSEIFEGDLGTSSGQGYDGTKPIAFIRVNNPQCYSLRTVGDIPVHTTASFERQPRNETHSIRPQPGGQALSDAQIICRQQPAPHGRAVNQLPACDSTLGMSSHPNTQAISLLDSASEPQLYPSTTPTTALGNKVEYSKLNNYRSTKIDYDTSTQTVSEAQYSRSHPSGRDGSGDKALRANEFNSNTDSNSIHSTIHTQSMLPPVTEGHNSVGLDYAVEISHHGFQGQALAESSSAPYNEASIPSIQIHPAVVGNASAPELNTFHKEGNLEPIVRIEDSSQGPPDHYQPSTGASYDYPPHGNYTWSHVSPSPVAGHEFQPAPVVVVPTPRRSLIFGAFLTPDPPCQISNIDLPPRPGTSPPRRTSAPNARSRLQPNAARRQSEQTWRVSDRVQLPQLPSSAYLYPADTNTVGENHSHALPSWAVPLTQIREQGNIWSEVDRAVETNGTVSPQPPIWPPFPNNTCAPQAIIPQSGRLQGHTRGNFLACQSKPDEQPDLVQQRRLNSNQMHRRTSVQTQAAVPTAQSRSSIERIDQEPQPLDFESSTQIVPSTTERHSAGRETATKRRYSHRNPETPCASKKRKVAGKAPEVVTNKEPDILVPPSQGQKQNSSMAGQDCVYFDVNTWRGDNITIQGVQQSFSMRSDAQTQLQSGDGIFMERSSGKPIGDSSEKTSENAPASNPSQPSPRDGKMAPLSESWLPEGQGNGTRGLQYMNCDPSANMFLDQTLAFDMKAVGALDPTTEQYGTALNPMERLALEAIIPTPPLDPSIVEFDQLLAYYHSVGAFSVTT